MDDSNTINITVRGLPKLLKFTIDKQSTVEILRLRVSNNHPCQLNGLSIDFNNVVLDGSKTLEECGIVNGSTLNANSNFKSGVI